MPGSGALRDARTISVPTAQSTEQARPKRQVAGESPAWDTNFLRVWFNSRMRPCQGRDDGATPFTRSTCPCGVVQPTRLPLMQEITGAKPVRDANFTPSKHCQRCTRSVSESARCNSGWGLQFNGRGPASQSSQRSSGFHKPAASGAAPETATTSPPCSSLRISFVRQFCRGSTGWRLHFAPAAHVAQRRGTTSRASPMRVQVPP